MKTSFFDVVDTVSNNVVLQEQPMVGYKPRKYNSCIYAGAYRPKKKRKLIDVKEIKVGFWVLCIFVITSNLLDRQILEVGKVTEVITSSIPGKNALRFKVHWSGSGRKPPKNGDPNETWKTDLSGSLYPKVTDVQSTKNNEMYLVTEVDSDVVEYYSKNLLKSSVVRSAGKIPKCFSDILSDWDTNLNHDILSEEEEYPDLEF